MEFEPRGWIFGLKARFEGRGGGQRRRRRGRRSGEAVFWALRLNLSFEAGFEAVRLKFEASSWDLNLKAGI